MHSAAMVAGAYAKTEIESRSPLELVVMLYDGANKYLCQAHDAIQRQDGHAKREAISRALAIVAELQNNLNMEAGGEIAESLDSLYSFVNGKLIDANLQDDVTAVDQAIRVLAPLRDAWRQVANSEVAASVGVAR